MGSSRRQLLFLFLSGLTLSVSTFLSFGNAAIVGFLGLYALFWLANAHIHNSRRGEVISPSGGLAPLALVGPGSAALLPGHGPPLALALVPLPALFFRRLADGDGPAFRDEPHRLVLDPVSRL